MRTVFSAGRRRRCSASRAGAICVAGGRIHPGDRVVRLRQHEYLHEADIDAMYKAVAVIGRFDFDAFWASMRAAFERLGVLLTAFAAQIAPAPLRMVDTWPMDDDPDRCWKCNAKPGVAELDGACWRCHYELTAAT